MRALAPQCKLYGVEPEAGNDGQQSLRKGEIVHIATPNTIADGAQTQHLGRFTFEVIRRDVDDILTASDAQLVEAMKFFAERMKMRGRAHRLPRLRGRLPCRPAAGGQARRA